MPTQIIIDLLKELKSNPHKAKDILKQINSYYIGVKQKCTNQ